jgi:hypothetical protein
MGNALVLTGLANFRVVGYSEVILEPELSGGRSPTPDKSDYRTSARAIWGPIPLVRLSR